MFFDQAKRRGEEESRGGERKRRKRDKRREWGRQILVEHLGYRLKVSGMSEYEDIRSMEEDADHKDP